MMEKRHMLHVTLYCSALSPCGNYLAVGDNYGCIAVFNLTDNLHFDTTDAEKKPFCSFKAHPGPVHALKTVGKFLVSAGYGPIAGWKWSDIINNKISKSWYLSKDVNVVNKSQCEMYNCILFNSIDNLLYSGGDDGHILAWDLKTFKNIESFDGHIDYVHDIDFTLKSLVSAGEDGLVKIWDTRSAQCTQTIEPYKNSKLNRSEYGRWLSCIAVDSNGQWIVCGGGPKTSLWHLRSNNLISSLSEEKTKSSESPTFAPNTITFHNNEIIAGGNQPNIHRWHVNGESKAVIPCSIKNIFSISFKPSLNNQEELPMIVTGNSPQIDLFANLGYLGTTLSLV